MSMMNIGERIRALREQKQMLQEDVENRTGLLRCYLSRVENGHTVPSVETLEKLASALDVKLYQLVYDGEEPPKLPQLEELSGNGHASRATSGKDARYLKKLGQLLPRIGEPDMDLLLFIATKFVQSNKPRRAR